MKISIREALFGGEEVDEWTAPTSEWIIANSPEGGWTNEFLGLKGLVGGNFSIIVMPHMFVIYDDHIQDYRSYQFSRNTRWKIWYNEKLDSYLVAHENSPKSIYENNDKLEKIQKYIEENLGAMERVVQYKKIGLS